MFIAVLLNNTTSHEDKDCQLELVFFAHDDDAGSVVSTVASSLGQLVVVGVLGTSPISTIVNGASVCISVGKAVSVT